MKVLVACERSGIVRDAFLKHGHMAMSCDLEPTDRPGPHYQGDVRDVLGDGWDMMIAHPECTYLTNAGVKHLHLDIKRWPKLFEGAAFFKLLLEAPIKYKCIENPIIHKYAAQLIGRRQDQVVQPHWFGHMEQKATCLWLENLPRLTKTNDVYDEMMKLPTKERCRIHYMSPGADRQRKRSETFPGVADAMVAHWGHLA